MFVNDERVKKMVGSRLDRVREAGHALCTWENYVLRKHRQATKPGAWAGGVVHNDRVRVFQDKWDSTKAICIHWHKWFLCDGHTELSFTQLEWDRNF